MKPDKILSEIKKEKNKEKQRMLQSVYHNNLRYAQIPRSFNALKKIIEAMQTIDRRLFVSRGESFCYSDEPLPIGHGQTISQPTTVARMLLLSQLKPKLDVLEVGAGSGWNAALAAHLVKPGKVITVERIKPLQENAKNNFNKLIRSKKIKLHAEFIFADALDEKSKVWKRKYDRIIVTAGAGPDLINELQKMGQGLLKEEGILLYPTNEFGSYGALELWQKRKGKLQKIYREEGYSFVPLIKGK